MKAKFLLSAFLLLAVWVQSQNPGDLDPSFGGIGYVTHGGPDDSRSPSIHLMADGRIVIGGHSISGTSGGFRIHRYHSNGDLDLTLAHTGMLLTGNPNLSADHRGDISLQPDGKILTVGTAYFNQTCSAYIARYNVDGTPDLSFGTNGETVLHLPEVELHPVRVFTCGSGKLVAVGDYEEQYSHGFFAVRFNADGSPDPTYGFQGVAKVLMGAAYGLDAEDALLDPQERVVIMAQYYDRTDYMTKITRIDAQGFQDAQFGQGGIVDVRPLGFGDDVYGVNLGPAGEMYVVGSGYTWQPSYPMALRKYSADGILDTGFGNQGIVELCDGFGDDIGMEVMVQPDGMIVVVGAAEGMPSENRFFVARFHPDGTPEMGFGFGGMATPLMTQSGEFTEGWSGVLQPDGKVLVGGISIPVIQNTTNYTAKYTVARYFAGPVAGSNGTRSDKDIALYPNPAANLAMLEIALDEDMPVEISVVDAVGRQAKVTVARAQFFSTRKQLLLDLKELESGQYVVKIRAGNQSYQQRLVVVH